jgi:hypothetical protein
VSPDFADALGVDFCRRGLAAALSLPAQILADMCDGAVGIVDANRV